MKFIKSKMIAGLVIASSLFAMPIVANAKNLVISNGTSTDFAFKVNGVCSQKLGTVYGLEVAFLSATDFNNICSGNIDNCNIQAFQDSCNGKAVGGINILHGTAEVRSEDTSYAVAVSVSDHDIELFYLGRNEK